MEMEDYVLATKYEGGDPGDHFAVGYYAGQISNERFLVKGSDGELFRNNGFRKVERISPELGLMILANIKKIEASDKSVWEWAEQYKAKIENHESR